MDVAFTLYKGFLIVEYSETDVKAYRNREYYAGNTTSYETSSQAFITQMIDDAGDQGDFTELEYHTLMRELGREEPEPSRFPSGRVVVIRSTAAYGWRARVTVARDDPEHSQVWAKEISVPVKYDDITEEEEDNKEY